MSQLTERQKDELHKSILDYLHSAGLTHSYEALLEETGCAFTPDPKARHAGLLEKKWTSVIRLQKKIMDLENRNAALTEEISAAPRRGGASQADWVPRAPAAYTLTGHRAQQTPSSRECSRRGEFLSKAPLYISPDSAGNLSPAHSITLHLPYHASANDINRLVVLLPDVCNAPRSLGVPGVPEFIRWSRVSPFGKLEHLSWFPVSGMSGLAPTTLLFHSFSMSIRDVLHFIVSYTQQRGFYSHISPCHTHCGVLITLTFHSYMTIIEPNSPTDRHVTRVAFHPLYSLLASASEDATIKLWDWETGDLERTLKGHVRSVHDLEFDSKGRWLVSCGSDMSIRLWDGEKEWVQARTFVDHDHSVHAVRFLPGDTTFVSASRDRTVKMWSVESGHCIKTIQAHDDWIRSVTPSEDGKLLATCSNDHTASVWDTSTAENKMEMRGHENVVEAVVFAPVVAYAAIQELASIEGGDKNKLPGQYVATCSRDRTIKIWSCATGQCLKTLAGHDNWVRALVFHPNGQLLLSACDDKTIRIWDLKTGRCTKTIEAHDHFVTSLAWGRADAGEGRRVNVCASGSVDQRVKIWLP
ncbi:Platelet-activating factor acetylhydrolase IB subunit alpha, partial [Rhizoctonia solani]